MRKLTLITCMAGIFFFCGCAVETEDTQTFTEDGLGLPEIQVGDRLDSSGFLGELNELDDGLDHRFDDIIQAIFDDDRELVEELISNLQVGEVEDLVDELQLRDIYPDYHDEDIEDVNEDGVVNIPISETSLAHCDEGYWRIAEHYEAELIEQRNSTNGLLYQIGPNCFFHPTDGSCGSDIDDFMLSFYFGNHAESLSQLRPMLRWYSTHWLVRLLLNGIMARVYEQTRGGYRDNYNIYFCLSGYFLDYLSTFRLRKY